METEISIGSDSSDDDGRLDRSKLTDPALWHRLEAFEVDEGDPRLSFEGRLARENAWHPSYTDAVMEEYRRFLYLAMVSDREVTPSIAIDQAWHLHLVYTRSYWERLCREVLGKPLHHGPTAGGRQAAEHYQDAYRRTLTLYEREFGHRPPPDIWPRVGMRFRAKQQPRMHVPGRHLVIRRGRFTFLIVVVGAAVLFLFEPSDTASFWLLTGVAAALSAMFLSAGRGLLRRSAGGMGASHGDDDGGSGCSGCGGD